MTARGDKTPRAGPSPSRLLQPEQRERKRDLHPARGSDTPAEAVWRGQALRRVLYGLSAIITLHLAKEEEIYLPLLEARFPAGEVDHLVEAMQRTVTEAKSTLKMMDPHE